jgi:hypothetical protein
MLELQVAWVAEQARRPLRARNIRRATVSSSGTVVQLARRVLGAVREAV